MWCFFNTTCCTCCAFVPSPPRAAVVRLDGTADSGRVLSYASPVRSAWPSLSLWFGPPLLPSVSRSGSWTSPSAAYCAGNKQAESKHIEFDCGSILSVSDETQRFLLLTSQHQLQWTHWLDAEILIHAPLIRSFESKKLAKRPLLFWPNCHFWGSKWKLVLILLIFNS